MKVGIDQSVHLESSFVMMKLSPRTKAQTNLYGTTGVHQFFKTDSEIIILLKTNF